MEDGEAVCQRLAWRQAVHILNLLFLFAAVEWILHHILLYTKFVIVESDTDFTDEHR